MKKAKAKNIRLLNKHTIDVTKIMDLSSAKTTNEVSNVHSYVSDDTVKIMGTKSEDLLPSHDSDKGKNGLSVGKSEGSSNKESSSLFRKRVTESRISSTEKAEKQIAVDGTNSSCSLVKTRMLNSPIKEQEIVRGNNYEVPLSPKLWTVQQDSASCSENETICERCLNCPCQKQKPKGFKMPPLNENPNRRPIKDMEVELAEGTGVKISLSDLLSIRIRAWENVRFLARMLLVNIMGGGENLVGLSAEGKRSKQAVPKAVRNAIKREVKKTRKVPVTGVFNTETQLLITDVILNDVINKKCQLETKVAKMSEQEMEDWKEKNRISAKTSREKRRNLEALFVNVDEGSIKEEMLSDAKEAGTNIEIEFGGKAVHEESMEEGSIREKMMIPSDKEVASNIRTEIEEKGLKKGNPSDTEGAALNEEKVFCAVEYPLDSYEYKSTTDFGRPSPNLQSALVYHEPMFTVQVKMEEATLKCEKSQRSFLQSSYLKKHRMTHAGEKPYLCDECGEGFSRNGTLKAHQMTHSKDRPSECDECKKRFWRSWALKSHKLTHTGEKLFQCEECERRFLKRSDLKRHKLTHTGEKRFQCDVCERRFLLSSNLKKHKTIHTGEKPFQCDECERRFLKSTDLKRHKMAHTGEKPYQCDECERRFVQSSDLKKHIMIHRRKAIPV